jgi:hypothetical protein
LAERIAAVEDYEWDEYDLVPLRLADVVRVLRRFLQGTLSACDVEAWADALEMREDVDYDSDVGESLFILATPSINGELTTDLAESLIKSYDGRPTR